MEAINTEKVNFIHHNTLSEKAEETFLLHKTLIAILLPEADIQHVGSSAVPNSITKGDLDIQVRVEAYLFPKAVQELSKLYEVNEGSTKSQTFRAFKDDSVDPPLGVQLTVIGSEYDFFWKFRDILIMNEQYRKEYDELKRNFEGRDMELYRKAKNEFFERLMETPEFQQFDR
ncbi:GrpB family protein [Mesobacillus jeotgali]|uniref:GrpB family protein n=1 Tax=Mesobacillus jeotgali TaxID=129985 RepID=UPI001CE251EE|nr:GrpB family protein [Mesobacillus jeotgali]UYZ24069.1 GrpB family protein [Mesobacillus jeotgali]